MQLEWKVRSSAYRRMHGKVTGEKVNSTGETLSLRINRYCLFFPSKIIALWCPSTNVYLMLSFVLEPAARTWEAQSQVVVWFMWVIGILDFRGAKFDTQI